MQPLPLFTYHPDPVASGVIAESEATCPCCHRARGYAYVLGPYGPGDHENICPWCIADGSAATKLEATFVDASPLARAGVPAEVVTEIEQRTPGFVSWQQEHWLSCCNDACEFHGDAPVAELRGLDAGGLQCLSEDSGFSVEDLPEIIQHYKPRGSPAFYKFICRHCDTHRYSGDCD